MTVEELLERRDQALIMAMTCEQDAIRWSDPNFWQQEAGWWIKTATHWAERVREERSAHKGLEDAFARVGEVLDELRRK